MESIRFFRGLHKHSRHSYGCDGTEFHVLFEGRTSAWKSIQSTASVSPVAASKELLGFAEANLGCCLFNSSPHECLCSTIPGFLYFLSIGSVSFRQFKVSYL